MYEFSAPTERIEKMRELIRGRVLHCDAERGVIMMDAYKKYEHVIPIIKRPLALKELCERMTIIVEDFEIIVGNKGPSYFGTPAYPEWAGLEWLLGPVGRGEWNLKEDGLYHNPDDEELRL